MFSGDTGELPPHRAPTAVLSWHAEANSNRNTSRKRPNAMAHLVEMSTAPEFGALRTLKKFESDATCAARIECTLHAL